MILHFYFARKFFIRFISLTLILFVLIWLVDLIDQLRRFSGTDAGFVQVLQLAFMKSIGTLDEIIPLNVLLSTVIMFIGLARSSEMVVTRASGRSALRALIAPVAVALLIGVITVSVLGPIVAALSNRYAVLSESYLTGGRAALSVSSEGLWLRQGGAEGQTVISAVRSSADASILYDVTFLSYKKDSGPSQRISAQSAALTDGAWDIRNAKVWTLSNGGNPEADTERHDRLTLPTSLTLDRIREAFGTSSGVSVWDMPTFIAQLEQAGFSALRHEVWLQSQLARPLFLMAMVLVGAAFTMRHTRFGGTGPAVISAVLLGFLLYFARSFATILGENAQLAVPLSAWAVPVAAILLAMGVLLHAEDG